MFTVHSWRSLTRLPPFLWSYSPGSLHFSDLSFFFRFLYHSQKVWQFWWGPGRSRNHHQEVEVTRLTSCIVLGCELIGSHLHYEEQHFFLHRTHNPMPRWGNISQLLRKAPLAEKRLLTSSLGCWKWNIQVLQDESSPDVKQGYSYRDNWGRGRYSGQHPQPGARFSKDLSSHLGT